MTIQQAELYDARAGTLYFLGNLKMMKNPSFDLGLINNFVSGTGILSDLQSGAMTVIKSTATGKKVVKMASDIIKPIKDAIASFFDALMDRLTGLYGEAVGGLEWLGEFGSWAVSTFAGSLADVIPGLGYVQGVSDLYDGTKKAVLSAIKWLGQVYSGWGVQLLEGGPSTIAQAIARHNATGLAGGLKDMAVSSTSIGLQAAGDAAGGAGSIFSAVVGILQRIANLVGYCVQRFLVSRTFSQAKNQWDTNGEMKSNHTQFNSWFKRSVVCTPIIAALVMSSGYVANPIKFLALFDDKDEVISQQKFDDGVQHIEKLKSLSSNYIKEYSLNYKVLFKSDDGVISSMLGKAYS